MRKDRHAHTQTQRQGLVYLKQGGGGGGGGGHLDEIGDDLVVRLESCSWCMMKDKTGTDKVSSILNKEQVRGEGSHLDELGDDLVVGSPAPGVRTKSRHTHRHGLVYLKQIAGGGGGGGGVSSMLNNQQVSEEGGGREGRGSP